MAKEAPPTAGRGTPIANLSKEVNSLETSGYSEYLIHHSSAAKARTPLRLEEGLDVTIQSLEASPGDEICLDVTVANFMSVAALSFTINYDKDILAFDAVTNVVFPNVNEFTFGETFGTPTGPEPIEEGFVTMVWTSPGLQPFNLADGTVIFQVCFTVIGNATTNVSITSDLTPIDVIDANEQPIMLNATPGVVTLAGGGGNNGGGGTDINIDKCSETYNGFTVIANDVSAQPGDQICVDVCVANFTNIAALSLTMNYDDAVLDFDTVTNIVFPNVNQFTYGETFGTPAGSEPIDAGFVTMVWTSPGLQPFNLANGTVIFQVCFTVKANTTAGSTKLEFTSDLTPIDVINANEQNVPFNGVDGTIDLGGEDNGGGGGGTDINTDKCSETYNGFTVIANDVSAQPGDQICVDVCVANFTNIAALSLTMNYDETVLDFDTVTNIVFPNVNQFTYGETFGTPAGPEPIDDGFITMVWTSPGLQPFNLANGTVIFQVCFTVKSNTTASSTKLEFTSDLTPIDVINANEQNVPFNGVDGTIAIGGDNGGGGGGGGNTDKCGETYSGFTVIANDVNAQPGDQICVDVCVANFTNIAALSMTMEYDENVLEFDTVNSIVFPNVNEFTYGETFGTPNGPEPIADGFITMVWTSPGLQPFNLADGTVIFQLCFTVKQNTTASSTKVKFSSALTPIDVINANEQNVPFNGVEGTVFIGDNGGGGGSADKCSETYNGFTVVINDALAQPGDQVCLDVCVANFTNIAGLSFTIEYDKDLLAFDTVDNIIFPNVDQFNYNETFGTPNGPEPIDEGFITMVWTSPGIQPWSYEDGTVIFQLCFTVIGDQDADVTFSSELTPIDVIDANEQNVPFNGVNGKVIIGTLAAPTIVNPVSITNVDCFGQSTGAIDISLEGGSGNFSYAWSNNAATQDLNGLPAGQYSLTVTDNVSGLQTQGSFTVNQPAAISINSVNITDVACAGESTGAITVMAGGGTGALTYAWSNNLPAGNTQAGLSAGTYRFTVTDANGCQMPSGDLLVRDVNPLLEINSIVPSSIQTGAGGGVTLSVGGGNGEYSYQWSGPQAFSSTNANLTNLSIPGEYCVTVTDEVGCTVTACTNVFAPLAFGDVAIQRACPGEASGSITLNIIGGVPDYSYQWNTGATSRNLSGLAAGSYTVTVTDDSGTQVNASFDVSEYTPITIDPDMEPVSAMGAADGSINLNISGGTPPYAVNWDNGATGRTLNNLSPGEYCVTITDQNGCVQEGCVNVILLLPLAFEVQKTDIRCNGAASGVLALTVTGGVPPYSVQFSDGASMSSEDGTIVRNGLTSRQYAYTITDARGETIQGNTAINQPDPIALSSIDVRHDNEELGCTGSIVIQVSGGRPGYSVRWNSPNTGVQIVGLCEGLYVPTIVDANNCEVTLPGIPVTTFSVRSSGITNTSCPMDPTGRIDLDIRGGAAPYTFEWTNEAGELVSNEEDLSGVIPGRYNIRVTEESGNVIAKSFTITAQSNLGINVSVASNFNGFGVSCPDATDGALVAAGMNGSGNYSYEWLQGDAMVGTGAMLTGVGPGEYQAMVIDELGCEMVQTISLSAPPPIVITSNEKDVNCPGDANGEIIVNATGGISTALYSYQWSNGNIGQRNAFLTAGDYSVTVTDINKCSASQSFNIAEPDPIVVTVETQPATEGCNGVATAIVQGGTPPYSFTWDQKMPVAESIYDKLCHGVHFLKVTDSRGCLIEQELLQFTVKDRRFPCIEVREVITPDGDGLNERFVINCIEEFPDNTLQIFNRWGQLVYQIEGYDCTDQGGVNCFFGDTNKGEELPDGAYYYVLEFTDSEGNLVQRKGALTIIRE